MSRRSPIWWWKKIKEELNASFTDEYIRNAGTLIHRLAEQFYHENDLTGKVYFNDDIFELCLIDILVDLARLKYFHDISRVNYVKFIAYTASWCLKRKPFQIIEGCGEEYIYVNERFALTLLLQASGCYDENAGYCTKDREELAKGVKQMYYHLKYRNTNPQTLELFLIGLEIGRRIYTASWENRSLLAIFHRSMYDKTSDKPGMTHAGLLCCGPVRRAEGPKKKKAQVRPLCTWSQD